MEERRNTIFQHLTEINTKKDKIRQGLTLSRQTYAAYQRRRRKVLTFRFSFAAVGMAAAIMVGFVFVPSLVRMDTEKVFAKNYQRFVFEIHDRGTGTSDRLISSAEFYMKGQHREALKLLDSADYGTSDKVRAQFIKGLTELDRDNDPVAEVMLKEVADAGGVLGNAAGWYLSLLYVKEMRYPEAAKWLKIVKETKESPYARSASKLFHRVRFRETI